MAIATGLDTQRATPAVMFGFDPLDDARYLASGGQARRATLVAWRLVGSRPQLRVTGSAVAAARPSVLRQD